MLLKLVNSCLHQLSTAQETITNEATPTPPPDESINVKQKIIDVTIEMMPETDARVGEG